MEKGFGLGQNQQQGSITVFLTLIFGLILALVTATIENVRFLTADSYVLTAADSAAMAVFGSYNKELYEEYGLFAYGGYDGMGVNAFMTEFTAILEQNLAESPEKSRGNYTAVYRPCNLVTEAGNINYLVDEAVFYQQVEDYLAAELLSDFSDKLVKQFQGSTEEIDGEEMQKNLDTSSQYEHGDFQVAENPAQSSPPPEAGEAGTEIEDHAGGNPLETFRKLFRDGILSLVCEEKEVAEGSIETCYSKRKRKESQSMETDSAADILKHILGMEESSEGDKPPDKDSSVPNLLDSGLIENTKKKGELLCYADQVFTCYGRDRNNTVSYALEYLVSGEEEERDNLLEVVERILVFRTLMNYAYVKSDPGLQSESLATATAIAAALKVPVLIKAIQQTILLILSVEESFVDITALLEGRYVPIAKDASSFQMTYPEICSASRALFRQKAGKFQKAGSEFLPGFLTYQQYLMLLFLMVPEKTLRLRSYDLIQYDLQRRYNPSFSLEQSICGVRYQVSYDMPFLWGNMLQHNSTDGMLTKSITSCYQYE